MILGPAARVMSLRDAGRKMSKSDPSEQSRVDLTDDAETIALKVRRAKTDPEPLPSEPAGLDGRPEAANLVGVYAALADMDVASVLREHGGRGFGAFKEALAERLVATLAPIAGELRRWLSDPAAIDAVLRDGAARAAAIGRPDRGRGRAPGGVSGRAIGGLPHLDAIVSVSKLRARQSDGASTPLLSSGLKERL